MRTLCAGDRRGGAYGMGSRANQGSYAKVNGLNTYYEIHGKGQPLLVLHGATGSIEFVEEMIKKWDIGAEFQVIAPEQMGHGRTADAMDRDFNPHDMAEDMVELMRQLEIDSAFVVGASMGGVIGFDMAIHHPDRVTKLAVTGANFRRDGVPAQTLEWAKTIKAEDWPRPLIEAYERLLPDGLSHWPVFFERCVKAEVKDYTPEQMASIKAPTLIIVGDQDMVTPEHAVATFRAIPGSQLCVVPHSRHGALPMETVLTFLREPVTSAH